MSRIEKGDYAVAVTSIGEDIAVGVSSGEGGRAILLTPAEARRLVSSIEAALELASQQ